MADESLSRIADAYDLAARAHEGQTRGHGRGEPFINHVADVARRVTTSPDTDEDVVIAAVLHDVVEKTSVPLEEIAERYGPDVAGVVAELTDDPSLSEIAQRQLQIEHAPALSPRAKRVKLADKASKMATIAETPPRPWARGKAREELDWARQVVDGLRGVDPALEEDFDREADRLGSLLGR